MKGFLQTVTGPVAHTDMGLTLPHEFEYRCVIRTLSGEI